MGRDGSSGGRGLVGGMVWLNRLLEETDGLNGGDGVNRGLMVWKACLHATATVAPENV